jgi:hypothetical protein
MGNTTLSEKFSSVGWWNAPKAQEGIQAMQPSLKELFEHQRKLASSSDPLERFKVLWIMAELGERLEQCSDEEIGDLLDLVQEGLCIFSPEFAVVEHAKRRLLQRTALETRMVDVPQNPVQSLHFVTAVEEQQGMLSFCCETQPLMTVRSHRHPKRCPFCQQENPVLTILPTNKGEEKH